MFFRSLLCACCLLASSAHAQEKNGPPKPVRIVMPSASAGPNDVSARMLAGEMSVGPQRMFLVGVSGRNNFKDVFARRNGEASPSSGEARRYIVSRLESGREFGPADIRAPI